MRFKCVLNSTTSDYLFVNTLQHVQNLLFFLKLKEKIRKSHEKSAHRLTPLLSGILTSNQSNITNYSTIYPNIMYYKVT